jgi:hypothetical protein
VNMNTYTLGWHEQIPRKNSNLSSSHHMPSLGPITVVREMGCHNWAWPCGQWGVAYAGRRGGMCRADIIIPTESCISGIGWSPGQPLKALGRTVTLSHLCFWKTPRLQ